MMRIGPAKNHVDRERLQTVNIPDSALLKQKASK
jgi:hypothetical protein